jgi:hypothetical protein
MKREHNRKNLVERAKNKRSEREKQNRTQSWKKTTIGKNFFLTEVGRKKPSKHVNIFFSFLS